MPYDSGQPFGLMLRYDSTFADVDVPLGRGWRHEYQASLAEGAGGRVTISWGGHHRHAYRLVEIAGGVRRYVSDENAASCAFRGR